MKGPEEHPINEAGLRRELRSDEAAQGRAWRRTQPERAAAWEEEQRLNTLLRTLPDRPLSPHFTSQVLAAVTRESAAARPATWRWAWLRPNAWLPRLALAVVVVGLGAFVYQQHQWRTRAELARSIAHVSELTQAVSLDLIHDLESIQRLSQVPVPVDEDLLAALE